jgi:hypothetical protein
MTVYKQIAKFIKEHYEPLDASQLRQEANRLAEKVEKQSAGRVCERTREDWDEARENFKREYKDKSEWNKLFLPRKSAAKE